MDKPSVPEIMEAAAISRTHAYDILAGRQEPSLKVAFDIYDRTGAQFGLLSSLPEDMVERLRSRAAA